MTLLIILGVISLLILIIYFISEIHMSKYRDEFLESNNEIENHEDKKTKS